MSALHPKSAHWVRSGMFDDLKTFADLEARVNIVPEEKDRGDIFEIFIEGYLSTQAITQCSAYWIVGNIPVAIRERYNLPNDATGIDGIYEAHNGSHVAYQVKYRQKQNLTFAEVAPFLGITEAFSDRVIFTNAATLSDKALARTRWVSSEQFNALSENQLSLIGAWLRQRPAPIIRATPDPKYQVQALADISAALKSNDRATVVMACGTGKTLVALWATEQANPKTVLVLVPSLTLMQQTLLEWSEQTNWGSRFSYLCVCSDKTVGLKDDSIDIDVSEVGFPIDTDPQVVRQFLQRETEDIKVIFSTYQSSAVVGKGAKGLAAIDLAIFDEAHKTTGISGGMFSYALLDDNILIRKRLFLTATPRHIDIRHKNKEGDFRVQSMDDEKVYGPRAHTLSFAKAAEKGIICKYKVVISLMDKQIVDDFTRKNGITIVEGDAIGARWVANLIALERAIVKVDAKKIISFHSRVNLARDFAKDETRGIAHYLPHHDVRHVNGSQNSAVRSDIIRAFSQAPKALLTNARCLTEGVNIPAVDMVAFIDPRQSRIDIAQAVGRAMRKPRGPTTKTVGYVLVQLFAGMADDDSLEEAIKSDKFDAIADVLNALQEHDEELADIVREIKERKGAGLPFNPQRLDEKIEFIGPTVALDQLSKSIGIAIADRLGSNWDESFGMLVKFKEREGHCRVLAKHTESAFKLGAWVNRQRSSENTIFAERRARLDAIGLDWNPHTAAWENGFVEMVKFKTREGHCRVLKSYVEEAFNLGVWAAIQRRSRRSMPTERTKRLNAIGFEWSPHAASWEKGFSALEIFKEREGNCRVPDAHVENGFSLGRWIGKQRLAKDHIETERADRLNAMGFEWAPLATTWDEGYAALEQFRAREGHCLVPVAHIEGTYKLGAWSHRQRGSNKATIPVDRVLRLDAIGFEWDPYRTAWDKGFSALEQFRAREGHCLSPVAHIEGTYKLGQWVVVQRQRRDSMPIERRERLEAIEFVWRVA